ncbi:MAG: serpin family protein [bacterium]
MIIKQLSICVVALSLIFAHCSNNPVSSVDRELTALEKDLVEADNGFGFKLFEAINETEENKNLFISPLSVSMALGMTLNGADGETKSAMEQTLEFAGMTTEEINQAYLSLIDLLTRLDSKVDFTIANSIWYRQEFTFKQEFLAVNQDYFRAVVAALNFNDPQSVHTINAWVSDNTNGKIKKIVERIDPEIVMFLINAIYFKGDWTIEFDKDRTIEDQFTLSDGSSKTCKMMQLTTDLAYFENDLFQAVNLTYGQEKFSMTILLPKPQVDLDFLIGELNPENWRQWLNHFATTEVALKLPKFKLEYEIALKKVLTAMGMGVAFEPYQADFGRMYEGPGNLFISKVKHKTFVEVNEEGTEAAAATSVEIGVTSIGPPAGVIMRVDRPFLFVIAANNAQTLLFMGKIVEPKWQ